jgi:hypothetical protein
MLGILLANLMALFCQFTRWRRHREFGQWFRSHFCRSILAEIGWPLAQCIWRRTRSPPSTGSRHFLQILEIILIKFYPIFLYPIPRQSFGRVHSSAETEKDAGLKKGI